MTETTAQDLQDLFREAVARNDAVAMRAGLEQLLGLSGSRGLDAEQEYELRAPDFVLEMPQSNERIRGRDAMREMQRAFPAPPQQVRIRRVLGAGPVWVLEGELDYGQGPWCVAVILEFDNGLIARETRYYTEKSPAPEWRRQWVEPLE